MGNMFGMFSFAFWVIRTLTCEAANILKFEFAGVPVRPFEYLRVPILIIACAPCMHARDAHAHCDVTRFTYDENHVTMTSPAFTFHLCHIEMRWHDINSVHVVGTPCHHVTWFTLHGDDVGMTSSCSHHVRIVLMMSSCSDHDVIMTHVNHDCSHGT